jgi:hypothetical protein
MRVLLSRILSRTTRSWTAQARVRWRTEGELRTADAFYYEVAAKELDEQFHDIEIIDARASTLFTIGSTILPITAGLLTTREDVLDDSSIAKAALFFGFFCYLILVVFFVWSYRINKWDSRPDLAQWRDETVNRTEEELQRWLGNACVEAYETNEPFLERKASKIGVAVWCLAGEAASLTIAVLAPLWPPW